MRLQHLALCAVGGVLVLFLAAPIIALMAATPPATFLAGAHHPLVAPALRLSLLTTSLSLVIVLTLGTPLAWVLARSTHRFASAIESITQLPIVVPPAVAGVAMLLAFGRRGIFAAHPLSFTTAAVVM